MKPLLEDYPPMTPSWRFRAGRFFLTSDIPLALLLASLIFIFGACVLSLFFMATP